MPQVTTIFGALKWFEQLQPSQLYPFQSLLKITRLWFKKWKKGVFKVNLTDNDNVVFTLNTPPREILGLLVFRVEGVYRTAPDFGIFNNKIEKSRNMIFRDLTLIKGEGYLQWIKHPYYMILLASRLLFSVLATSILSQSLNFAKKKLKVFWCYHRSFDYYFPKIV